MPEQIEKGYEIKLQDFIPFAGSFIYQSRDWNEAIENGRTQQESYGKYFTTCLGLAALNVATGFASIYAVFQGLESLIK